MEGVAKQPYRFNETIRANSFIISLLDHNVVWSLCHDQTIISSFSVTNWIVYRETDTNIALRMPLSATSSIFPPLCLAQFHAHVTFEMQFHAFNYKIVKRASYCTHLVLKMLVYFLCKDKQRVFTRRSHESVCLNSDLFHLPTYSIMTSNKSHCTYCHLSTLSQ